MRKTPHRTGVKISHINHRILVGAPVMMESLHPKTGFRQEKTQTNGFQTSADVTKGNPTAVRILLIVPEKRLRMPGVAVDRSAAIWQSQSSAFACR